MTLFVYGIADMFYLPVRLKNFQTLTNEPNHHDPQENKYIYVKTSIALFQYSYSVSDNFDTLDLYSLKMVARQHTE